MLPSSEKYAAYVNSIDQLAEKWLLAEAEHPLLESTALWDEVEDLHSLR